MSVNVTSFQDHGSRQTARIKGGREESWYIAERVLVGQRTFDCVHVGGFFLFSELKDGTNMECMIPTG